MQNVAFNPLGENSPKNHTPSATLRLNQNDAFAGLERYSMILRRPPLLDADQNC